MPTVSVRLNDKQIKMIESIKKYYAKLWNVQPDEFTTSQIIKWCIGSKYEKTDDWKKQAQKEMKELFKQNDS